MRAFRTCSILALVLLCLTWAGGAFADTTIYGGAPISGGSITLGPWGSGFAEESSEKTLVGEKSIRIMTGGWFKGGSIEFKTPVAICAGAPTAEDYFVLSIAPTMQNAMSTDTTDLSWYLRGGSPTPSTSYDFGAETIQRPKIQRLRLVMIDDKGGRSEFQPSLTASGESGWMNASTPLSKFKAGATGYSLKRMLIFSDVADTIFLGAIKVRQDSQAITAEIPADLTYASGDTVPFEAGVTAGLSSVKCSWDFDDKDGIQEDAVGEYAKHVYTAEGNYVVTLTVSDKDGVKSPFTKTIKVRIE